MRRLLLLLFCVLLAPALPSQEHSGDVRAWEHESSDIPPDPRIHFGHFENGLRWAWEANSEPRERCYLRLHVNVGSLAEGPEERGLAHFLEHMAFNGSEHYPAGSLIEWFQAQGMAFGADTNATTGFSQTIYKLDLPTSDASAVRSGLTVLRDMASGLLLEEDEIQAEKGVIDGEQRERDSAGFRVFVGTLERLCAGTRFPQRLPIGAKEVRDAFDAGRLRRFYGRWYRPENMTLIAVGDFGDLDPVPLFEEAFGDLAAPASDPVPEPDPGTPAPESLFFSVYEPEIPQVTLVVQHLVPFEDRPSNRSTAVEDLDLELARQMLNTRFREMLKEADTPFLAAALGDAGFGLKVFDGTALTVVCEPERWKEALAAAGLELRRALTHGFQTAELEELRADVLRGLDEAVEREQTRSSRARLRAILAAAEDRVVPADAGTDRAILRPAITSLTVGQCREALAKSWAEGELSIHAAGKLDLGPAPGPVLRAAWEAAWSAEVEAGDAIHTAEFAYHSAPAPAGRVARKEYVEDPGFWRCQFSNGVRLNLKVTDFKERQVVISARLGEGKLSREDGGAVLAFVADRAYMAGGLEAHSNDDLRRINAGHVVGVHFSAGDDAFILGGTTTPDDLLLQFELMAAFMEHPGWRPDGIVRMRPQLPLIFQRLQHQIQGPLVLEFLPALFGGDPRFTQLPPLEELLAVDVEAVRSWLEPSLTGTPLEVTVVGDFDAESALAAGARTFGGLPKVRERRAYEARRKAAPVVGGLEMRRPVQTQIPKSLVFIAFPAGDGLDAERRWITNFLGVVVNDRLRLEVRERLGAAYSPAASVQVSETYPGVGMLFIQALSDPDKVGTLREACLGVARKLAEEGVTQEETDRLKTPFLAQLRDARRTNGFWIQALSGTQERPQRLEDLRRLDAFYEQLQAGAVSDYAARYLRPDAASVLVVDPRDAAAGPAGGVKATGG